MQFPHILLQKRKQNIMNLPRKDTNGYKILQILHKNGALNIDELLKHLALVSVCRRSWAMESLTSLLKKNLVRMRHDKYYLFEETIALLNDVMEIQSKYERKNIVSAPYHNVFTPELRNYNLFANKRGY
jgi:signal transduction histidine kinase